MWRIAALDIGKAELVDGIPGIGATAAAVIIAEVGVDMTASRPRRTFRLGPASPQGQGVRRA